MDIGSASDVSITIASTGFLLKMVFDFIKSKPSDKEDKSDQTAYNAVMTSIVKDLKEILIKQTESVISIGHVVSNSNMEIRNIGHNLDKLSEKSENRAEILRDIHSITKRDHNNITQTKDHINALAQLYSTTKFCREA